MSNNNLDIKADNELIEVGTHFWCLGCLAAKLASEQSLDPRYCRGCSEVLKEEADRLPTIKKPGWAPASVVVEASPSKQRVVTKPPEVVIPIPRTSTEVLLQKNKGGRPRKQESVTRMTEWRREKGKQGALL